jgi:HK97 family phage portal protein
MAILDRMRSFFALEGPIQQGIQQPRIQKRESATLEDFAIAVLGNSYRREWQRRTVQEALGIPAILNAVSMLSSVVGSLSMEVLRNGVRIDRPSLISRPNPLTTPRDFFRDVTYSMATRGEAWLWIAKRDSDRSALALVPLNPVQVYIDLRNGRRVYRYADKEIPEDDLIQITYLRELGAVRGSGPLQLAGAAVSVAFEAQEWAANFYAQGGFASTVIKHASELDPTVDPDGLNEAQRLLAQWEERQANNVTRVIDQNIESIEHHEPNEAGAQMLTSRMYQNGEVANMFGIPGALLEYNQPGASLTYRNNEMLMRQFVDLCLSPRYLEPIEQVMSDLLPRNQIAQFDRAGLLRADVKTQYDVAALGFEKGVLERDEARAIIGLEPSLDVEPIPFAPPRAVPTLRQRGLQEIRCSKGHLVGKSDGNTEIKCHRCGQMAYAQEVITRDQPTPADRVADALIAMSQRETPVPQITVNPAPITINPPSVTVEQPQVNVHVPSTPVELRVETPESQERAAALIEQAEANVQANVQAVGDGFEAHIEKLTELERRISEVAEAATRPRTFVPERDDAGRIVKVTQH